MSDLRSQIEGLSASEKAELLDAVWQSLEADALELTDEQRSELDHRIERHSEDPDNVVLWEQVRADLFKKL
jgi:putative addiction module component (TIGR02574 family)